MKILIKVTKEILERSKMCGFNGQKVPTHCGIAEAVRDIFPNAGVYCHSVERMNEFDILPFGDHGEDRWDQFRISLPQVAADFVILFDSLKRHPQQRATLPELSFEIEVPSEVIDKIGIGEVYRILSESKTLELVQP